MGSLRARRWTILFASRKEIIAVDEIADELMKLAQYGGYRRVPTKYGNSKKSFWILRVVVNTPIKFRRKKCFGHLEAIGTRITDRDPARSEFCFCEVEGSSLCASRVLMPPFRSFAPATCDAIEMAKRVEHGNGHTAVMYSKNIDNLHRMAKEINTSIFIKNAPSYAGLGLGGEGFTSFTIASPTGEGLTTCRTFSRIRRCTLQDHFRIV